MQKIDSLVVGVFWQVLFEDGWDHTSHVVSDHILGCLSFEVLKDDVEDAGGSNFLVFDHVEQDLINLLAFETFIEF